MPNPDGKMTAFDVKKHGFLFDNKMWPGDILIDVPVLGQLDVGDTTYGLCGGMSYAALDTWAGKGQAPPDPTQPPSGSQLRAYIYQRQIDTFKAGTGLLIGRSIAWTPIPIKTTLNVTGLHVRSDREFKEQIAPAIDAGRPVALGILRADINDVTRLGQKNAFLINHQVVAIGYRLCKVTPGMKAHWAVEIYDPNSPHEVHSMHYSDRGRGQTLHIDANGKEVSNSDDPSKNVTSKGFRAFFAYPYEAKRPYWIK